jgi:branched-chain amino acid transport system substrate-binding protein
MHRPSRTWRTLTAVAVTGLFLAACGTTDDDGGEEDTAGGGDGEAACDVTLAFFGPQTGPAAGLGAPIIDGAQLAVDQYNAEAECPVNFELIDSQGSPDQAPALATEAAGNEAMIGIVGPAFSGEGDAAGPIFAEAGLPTITASGTATSLNENGWDTWHRLVGNDDLQGAAAATYLKDVLQTQSVFVIDDASEYGAGLAGIIRDELGDAVVDTDTVQVGQTDFSATVTAVNSANPDTVFFSGYYPEAGPFARQLRNSGFEGTLVAPDGTKDPGFLEGAGAAAEGTLLTCPCIPATEPAVAEFVEAFEAEYGGPPGTYGAEAYDAANVFLQGIADGIDNREDMLTWVNDYDEAGITKQISFDETGEVEDVHIYAYKVEGGKIVPDQEIT